MDLITGLWLASLLLLGLALWRLARQRQDGFLKSKVIAATSCSVVVTDAMTPRHPVIYANPAFRLLTGYADDEVRGQSLSLLNGPHTDRGVIEKLAMAIQDGRACRVVVRHYRKTGAPFWNEVTLSPVKNRAGTVTEYIWVMSDATQRQQAEAALKDARDPSHVLADLVSDGIIVTGDSTIEYVNASGVSLLGAEGSEQVIGRPLTSFLHHESFPLVRQQLERGHSVHLPETGGRLVRLDGQPVDVNLSATPMLWQGTASCLWVVSCRPAGPSALPSMAGHLLPADTAAHLATWERDVHTGTEVWSEAYYRILGYDPETCAASAETMLSAFHPDDRDRVRAAIHEATTAQQPFDIECRLIRPQGDIRFVRYRGSMAPGSRPLRMWGTLQDLTEYKLIADVAKERDIQFRLVVESAPNGMLMFAQDGTISLVNARVEQLFGYAREELLGRPVELLLPDHLHQHPMVPCVDVAAPPVLRPTEAFGRRKDGSRLPVEVVLNPLHLSSGTSILATIVDLSDRRRTADALRESQERFHMVVQAAHVGIFEHDHRTDHLYWSPTLRDLYGVTPDEPVSLQRYIESVPREERDTVVAALQTAHDPAGDGLFQIEHRIVRAGGEVRHVAVRAQTLFEEDGGGRRPLRTIGTVVNMTDRKRAELYQRDASKMEAIGTLAGGIAHEFNNCLTAVLGFSELALPLIPADSKAYRHIQHVVAAGRKSRELVHQLLTFSQQSGHVRRPLSLHSLVKESLKLLRPSIPSWVEVRERIAGSTRPISADPAQMHQLILHLIENALHAMRHAGGVLDIQLVDTEFSADRLSTSGRVPAGCYACLTVRDSGEGMEPELASRIFDPFFTTAPPGEGRGMGLSVVHGIVTSHGGTVVVESQPDLGTTVSVYLPALPSRTPSVAAQDEPLPHGHECILFVDDEESLAHFGGEMLESLGYYPVVRMSAAEALQAFRIAPQQFHLLITDQTMPGMSGDMLARECQRLRPDLPVILCTGSDQTLPAAAVRSQGVTEYVLKPLLLHDLAHTIRRVLDARSPAESSAEAQAAPDNLEEYDAVSTRR